VRQFEISAAEYGIAVSTLEDIRGGEASDNLAILQKAFAGESGAVRDIVVFNAGCALHVAGAAESVQAGIDRARELIDSGAASAKLSEVVRVSQRERARMEAQP